MCNFLSKHSLIILIALSFSVNAETINKQDVPEKVFDFIYKKHPKAQDITVEEKIHFGITLYKVIFKENQNDLNNQPYLEEVVELFRPNGHFYTNEITVNPHAFNIISDATKSSLQSRYPDYKIQKMKAVANPNGVGKEYEIDLLVSRKQWNISIDDQGNFISENQLKN